MSAPLIKEFNYQAPIEKVWHFLVDTDKMKQWYFPQLERFEPVVGYKFQFADDGSDYQKEWVVTQVVSGKTLAHTWAYLGYPGKSEVIFNLIASGNITTLQLTQTNLDSFPDDPHFKKQRFDSGWDNLLGKQLKQLIER